VGPERITRLVQDSGSRLALGLTLQVRLSSEVAVDLAVGRARTQSPQRLRQSTPVPWFSASKLLTTIGIARAWEDGAFGLGDRVTQYLPAFATGGKDGITIRDLWSHTAPLVRADRSVNTSMTWTEAIDLICRTPADSAWPPGQRAAYLGHASFLILAEITSQVTGLSFRRFLGQQVLAPLGLSARLGAAPGTEENAEVPDINRPARNVAFNPAAGFPGNCVTGPFAETAILAGLLLNGGTHRGQRILRPETAAALTARHRVGLVDERHGVRLDWGLGLAIDSYLFGRHCSPDTFGQHGANSSVIFADPRHQLTVAMFFNGNCGLADHIHRVHALATAIYLDLGLVPPQAVGRDHIAPFIGVV
jgi:CubicO group peptidase (beta-lactamase class C family)